MLRPFLVSASLEGLEPGWRPPPRPVPVVWFDRVHRLRAGCLHAFAADLAASAAFPPAAAPPAVSATSAAGGGWRTVLFCHGPAPTSGTIG